MDAAQSLIGLIAEQKRVPVKEVYAELNASGETSV
jgi:hypothetical protein